MTQSVSKQTPLHGIHVTLGATMTDFAGWSMPLRYGSEIAEHPAILAPLADADLPGLRYYRVVEATLAGARYFPAH